MASSRYSTEDVSKAVESSRSWRQVCEKVGLKYAGGNVRTLKDIAEAYSIDFSHFLGMGWNLGGVPVNELSCADVFVKDSLYSSKSGLKKKVLKYGILPYRCSECNSKGEWMGKPLQLHLDHVNGVVADNRPENLRFLCPNCHSQTDTYCGRNTKWKKPK